MTVAAHNAGFERIMLNGPPGQRIGMPPVPDLARWDCTAGRAARAGLPRSLEGASHAAGLAATKDKQGSALMKSMMRPARLLKADRAAGVTLKWRDGPEDMQRLARYCEQDVRVERALDRAVPRLTPFERRVWEMTERMNDRGALIDTALLLHMLFLTEDAGAAMAAELPSLTGGVVSKVTAVPDITAWLKSFGGDLGKDGIGKPALEAMLERDDLPPVVRRVLMIRQEGGKASTAKYQALMDRLSPDRRVRGALVYCGAASTGRWSSRGVQLHNLVRPKILKKLSTIERMIDTLRQGASLAEFEALHGAAMPIASEMLRPIIVAPDGHHLVRGDSKQIEARVNPWLSGARWKLDAFARYDAGTGPDLYKVAAAGIYHVTPDVIDDEDPRRQIGKVSELALGFEGGANALQTMAKAYSIKIPRFSYPAGVAFEDREPAPDGTDEWIKQLWRIANPETVQFWRDLKNAAIRCMECSPGQEIAANGFISFRRNNLAIRMRLPSGTALYYRQPSLERVMMPWGKMGAGGRLLGRGCPIEAVAQVLLVWRAVVRKRGAGDRPRPDGALAAAIRGGRHPAILSVHDEGIGDAPMSRYPLASNAADAVAAIMRTKPGWADGLPVNADATAGPRYVKG